MLFNIFNKIKSDWKLDIDGVEKGECTVEDVEKLLEPVGSAQKCLLSNAGIGLTKDVNHVSF